MKTSGINSMIFCKIQGGSVSAIKAYDSTFSVFDPVCKSCNRCTKDDVGGKYADSSFVHIRRSHADDAG